MVDYHQSLDKFVAKMKNIIFFKVVMCIVTSFLLLWFWSIVRSAYQQELVFLENANNKLSVVRTKLKYATELQGKIAEIQNISQNIIQGITKDKCEKRTLLFNNLERLSRQYNLSQPIYLKMSKIFSRSYPELISSNIIINNYNLAIEFVTADFATMVTMIREMTLFLNNYDVLVTITGELTEVLTPKIIASLSEYSLPNMVKANVTIFIKEVNINQ